jgi:hypothetical protein
MELPSHPQRSGHRADEHHARPERSSSPIVVIVMVGLAVATLAVLHLAGVVGPGAR